MKAIIMAGGEGTRLRPLTCDLPKPMVPVMNKPVMQYSIELLKKYDIKNVAVTMQYLPDRIIDFFEDGSKMGVDLNYYIEDKPLGTAGSVRNAHKFLDDTFIVLSGDALTDFNLKRAVDFHKSVNSMVTLILKRVAVPVQYGIVITDKDSRILRFMEKPNWGEVFSDKVNTGVYIIEPEVLDYIKDGQKFDFSKDLFPILMKENKPIYGYVDDGYWCDIGDLQQYLNAHMDILNGKVKVTLDAHKYDNNIWMTDDFDLKNRIRINGPCYIGSNLQINGSPTIEPYTVIGDNCILYGNSSIKRSVIWDHAVIKDNVQLRGCVVCDKAIINKGTSAFDNSVIGKGSILGENDIVEPEAKIWPFKEIDSSTEIHDNVVWNSSKTNTLFGLDGITGILNIDITPEMLCSAASCYGSVLKQKSKIGIAFSSRMNGLYMLYNAIIAGLLSEGVEVYEIGQTAAPIARYSIKNNRLDGLIYIKLEDQKESKVTIEFMDSDGSDINSEFQRKIDNIYSRRDFNRLNPSNINDVKQIKNITDVYFENLFNKLKYSSITKSNILFYSEEVYLNEYFEKLFMKIGIKPIIYKSNMKYDDFVSNDSALNEFRNTLKYYNAEYGFILDSSADKLTVFDEQCNKYISEYLMALKTVFIFRSGITDKIYVPFNAPDAIEEIAKKYRGQVFKTKSSKQSIMKSVAETNNKDLFGLYFDNIYFILKLIVYLKNNDLKISQISNEIPKIHYVLKSVECPWRDKGKVIRSLIENEQSSDVELLEGVKIKNNKGWALILPDSERPVCNIYSNGYNEEYAESLTEMFAEKIRNITRTS